MVATGRSGRYAMRVEQTNTAKPASSPSGRRFRDGLGSFVMSRSSVLSAQRLGSQRRSGAALAAAAGYNGISFKDGIKQDAAA